MIKDNLINRFGLYKDLLNSSKYFKLVCGAGNEDKGEVEYLTFVYTLAGCAGFDVSANPEIVNSAKKGINAALEKAKELKIRIPFIPIITVSVGMPGDHHVRKAFITNDCVNCNLCIPTCPTNAIPENLKIIDDLCIGCGNCEAVCPPAANAIKYNHNSKELLAILPKCIEAGADSIELHAGVPDDNSTMNEWRVVSDSVPNGMISMCLDRKHLSNKMLLDRIVLAHEIAGERLIIQADGIPMSGGIDDFNTTLQAVSIADFLNKELKDKERKFKNLPILISGGTNSLTGKLARQCDVRFNGITIGTHARKLIKSTRSKPSQIPKKDLINAISNARNLIEFNLFKK
ncbi:4Fe-4S binding protein [Prochlorococcus sp. AH-736-D21]|nr:4Fe-4S binding protein [Prochlorococcus sp. AH-736-D21]